MTEPDSTWTDEQHAAAKARCEAATEGPWRKPNARLPWVHASDCIVHRLEEALDPAMHHSLPRWNADAEFIAHARTDLPAALAEIKRLRDLLVRHGAPTTLPPALAERGGCGLPGHTTATGDEGTNHCATCEAVPADLRARAEAVGLVRGASGKWWGHPLRNDGAFVGHDDDGRWWWVPNAPSLTIDRDIRHAPRFAKEAEALRPAVEWLEAGEPVVEVARG